MEISKLKEEAIKEAEFVYHYKLIANAIGRDEETLRRWRLEDVDFQASLDRARLRFIKRNVEKAKPEFLLERTERDLFAPPAQKVKVETENPIMVVLDKYGMGGNDAGKTEETQDRSSPGVA